MNPNPEELLVQTVSDFNEHGLDGTLRSMQPDVRWHGAPGLVDTTVFEGHDGVRELADMFTAAFEEFRWELSRVLVSGEGGVALVRQIGRTSGGATLEEDLAMRFALRDGLFSEVWFFASWEEAVEAAEGAGKKQQ